MTLSRDVLRLHVHRRRLWWALLATPPGRALEATVAWLARQLHRRTHG